MIVLCFFLLLMVLCGAKGKTIQDSFILEILCGATGKLYAIVFISRIVTENLFDVLGNLYKIVLY